MNIFSYRCELVKCSCLVFHRANKGIFINFMNAKAHILQSIGGKFFKKKFHMFLSKYTTRSYVPKKISPKFVTCTRNGSFGENILKELKRLSSLSQDVS